MKVLRSWFRGKWYLVLLVCLVLVVLAYIFRSKWLLKRAVSYRNEGFRKIVKQASKSQAGFQKKAVKQISENSMAQEEIDSNLQELEETRLEREKIIEGANYVDLERMFHSIGL